MAERSDLSSQIVHLTREVETSKVVDVLYEIVSQRQLIGSITKSAFICGSTPAVCFQDAPLHGICQNVFFEQKSKESKKNSRTRYKAFGPAFSKEYAFRKGARPVIYDRTSDAKKYLPPELHWKIVNFNLSKDDAFIDWTHEREWRVPGNFCFELKEATLLFVNSLTYQSFAKKCKENGTNFLEEVRGVVVMDNVLY